MIRKQIYISVKQERQLKKTATMDSRRTLPLMFALRFDDSEHSILLHF